MLMTWINSKLYLKVLPGQPWVPYTSMPGIVSPDHYLPNLDGSGYSIAGSQGYATMQKLLKHGWTLVRFEGDVDEL
jgi:hypothetical protein